MFKRRVDNILESFNRLSDRERVMLASLAGVFCLMFVLGTGYFYLSYIDELKSENDSMRKAISKLTTSGSEYRRNRSKLEALKRRMTGATIDLTTYVEQAAKTVGVSVDEFASLSPTDVGELIKSGMTIKLRKVKLAQLGALIQQLEENPQHVFKIGKLEISTRFRDHEQLDAEMTLFNFQLSKAAKPSDKG